MLYAVVFLIHLGRERMKDLKDKKLKEITDLRGINLLI